MKTGETTYSSSSIFLPLKDVLVKNQVGHHHKSGRGWLISRNHKNSPEDKSLQRFNGPRDHKEREGQAMNGKYQTLGQNGDSVLKVSPSPSS